MDTMYSVAIIGAGSISSSFDQPDHKIYLTHCHSICDNINLNPIGIYDIDSNKVSHASKKWSIKPFFNLELLLEKHPDIILIAVPDEYHYELLETVIKYKPKLVVCEKPLTTSINLSKNILKKYNDVSVELAVCYQRRYDEDFLKIRESFMDNDFGNFLSGTVIYSKGIMHNGSHAIDILRFIFGEVIDIKIINKRYDYKQEDPTVSAIISFDVGDIHLISGDERYHSLFEIDLIFETIRFRITDSGNYIDIYEVSSDPVYAGYSTLNIIESRKSTLNYALKNMWSTIVNHLLGEELLTTLAEDSIKNQVICHKLQN